MTTQVPNTEFAWKSGRNGSMEFCGNFKRLQEKEPKTAALLLGHFVEEGFQTEDVNYTYKIYHSAYGYSVGRRKKPVPDIVNTSTEESSQNGEIIVHGTNEQVLVRIAIALEGIDKTLKSMRGSM
jgi:hypothetical protein